MFFYQSAGVLRKKKAVTPQALQQDSGHRSACVHTCNIHPSIAAVGVTVNTVGSVMYLAHSTRSDYIYIERNNPPRSLPCMTPHLLRCPTFGRISRITPPEKKEEKIERRYLSAVATLPRASRWPVQLVVRQSIHTFIIAGTTTTTTEKCWAAGSLNAATNFGGSSEYYEYVECRRYFYHV